MIAFMNNWKETTLGEVLKADESTIDNSYPFDEIEYIDIASVEERKILQTQKLKLQDAPSRAKRIVRNNDILISTVRPNLKHYCFIKKATPNLIASTGFAVITAKKADPAYLYYLLTTYEYTAYLTQIAEGHTSAYPSFNPEIIENSKVLLPPLPEQKAIAAILSSFDDKIELLRRQNKTLESIAQAIFKEWFVNFTVNGKKLKIEDSTGLPNGWRIGKYGELTDVTTGKGLKKEFIKAKGTYSVLGANGELGKTDNYLFDEDLILTGRVGTLGTVYISIGKAWISDNVLISKPLCAEKFYFVYFNLKRINFESLNRGSTQPLITQTDLKNVELIIPKQEVLGSWHNVVSSLFAKIYNNNSQIQTLSRLRDALLPKLMKGEIRVKDTDNRTKERIK